MATDSKHGGGRGGKDGSMGCKSVRSNEGSDGVVGEEAGGGPHTAHGKGGGEDSVGTSMGGTETHEVGSSVGKDGSTAD